MKKILFIGNSFSTDATRYIEDIAAGELYVRNLYIGGCSLKMHAENIAAGRESYEYQKDADLIEMMSINRALLLCDWDYISIQQVSGESGMLEYYEPYAEQVVNYVRGACPGAKIVFHRTWAYEMGSEHPDFPRYDCDTEKMHAAICRASCAIAEKYSLPIIPSGDAVCAARALAEFDTGRGGIPITRDSFHLSLDYGRYLAGLVLYAFFTGKSTSGVSFAPVGTDKAVVAKLKKIADKAVGIGE
jgi:hypothetical protein